MHRGVGVDGTGDALHLAQRAVGGGGVAEHERDGTHALRIQAQVLRWFGRGRARQVWPPESSSAIHTRPPHTNIMHCTTHPVSPRYLGVGLRHRKLDAALRKVARSIRVLLQAARGKAPASRGGARSRAQVGGRARRGSGHVLVPRWLGHLEPPGWHTCHRVAPSLHPCSQYPCPQVPN